MLNYPFYISCLQLLQFGLHGILPSTFTLNPFIYTFYTSFNPFNWSTIMVPKTSAAYYRCTLGCDTINFQYTSTTDWKAYHHNVWPSTKYTSINLYYDACPQPVNFHYTSTTDSKAYISSIINVWPSTSINLYYDACTRPAFISTTDWKAYHQFLMHGHPHPLTSTLNSICTIYTSITLYSRMEFTLEWNAVLGGHSLIVITVLICCSDPHAFRGMQRIVNEQALAF